MGAMVMIMKYWRECIICLLLLAAGYSAIYLQSVRAERDRLHQDNGVLTTQLQDVQQTIELNNRITEVVGQIRVRSTINVDRIQTESKPQFVSDDPVVLVPGGVLQAVYSSAVTAGTASTPTGNPGVSAPASGS